MHTIEPHYNWRSQYIASEDERSPFYGREYDEFGFTNKIYDHYIHPQWDHFGSPTLFAKILYVNYDQGACVIEMMGEWNDILHNDIMHFKRNVIDELLQEGINKFLLAGDNVLIFHSSDDCYYEEWFDDLEDGWIALANFKDHVLNDMMDISLDQYILIDDKLKNFNWRSYNPENLSGIIENLMTKRLSY